MSDGWKIIAGLIIVIGLVTFPFYANFGKTVELPSTLEADPGEMHLGDIPLVNMRSEHMQLLNRWREEVVREDERYIMFDGDEYEKSLQNGCLSCHEKEDFCTKCHTFVGVRPYCWDCHIGM
ncbi:MAG TPA: cytochrome C [Nitrospirae bacterium]|nr:hypothetical protein BMS3Abin10_00463 [bacterium BMS3Abin10]GBE37643.1 hypothetical protein BMS3Bbin08_00234 [bacterium BMS3Bbin08]HDH51302.1 cytochrome C [Nitrospirota bacterium]HDK81569.1 cytochrome C [Nitrospirota bacterium]